MTTVYDHDKPDEIPWERRLWTVPVNNACILGVVISMTQRSQEWYALVLDSSLRPEQEMPQPAPPVAVWEPTPATRHTVWIPREVWGIALLLLVQDHVAAGVPMAVSVDAKILTGRQAFSRGGLVREGNVLIGQRVIWNTDSPAPGEPYREKHIFTALEPVQPPSADTLGMLLTLQTQD